MTTISPSLAAAFVWLVVTGFSFGKGTPNPDLPDCLTFLEGRKVETPDDWQARKAEIKRLWCHYFLGAYPTEVPALLSARVTATRRPSDGSTRKRVELTFDTPNQKSFEVEVWEPGRGEGGRRPLLLTQPRHYQREQWGEEALRRGYVVCLYPGLDVHHTEKDYPGYQNVWKDFQKEYPDAGWVSSLGIQAWLASRALDYLLEPQSGYRIDPAAVGITGFSRYGKQSIYAAAFDERFTCVVARSSGSPTACGYRYSGRHTFMETPVDAPGPWLKDTVREFYGREHELPIAGNALMACIAPRHLLIDTAYNDGSDPTFGVERSYLNAKQAWKFLGAETNIRLNYRKGNHGPVTLAQVRDNLDFFDRAFGRATDKAREFPEVLLHHFDWQAWRALQEESDLVAPDKMAPLKEKIAWMLGEKPSKLAHDGEYHIKTGDELGVPDSSRDRWNPGGIKRVPFSFSGRMHGNLFFDPNREHYRGTVIWLHPWNYSHGSNEGYGVQDTTIYYRLAREGYLVVMYDQFGFGDHLLNAVDFYDRHPRWSRLGRTVHDVSRVLDFLIEGKGITAAPVPPSDPEKIYLCGFAYGGLVGLYAAALDDRIAGLACFSGFTPMRSESDDSPTGGLRRFWEKHALLPKLGLYHQEEETLPYDYHDLLRLIAPRPCLIQSPARDRFSDHEAVNASLARARPFWKETGRLQVLTPDDICRFQRDQQLEVVSWLAKVTHPAKGESSHEKN